MCKDLKRRNKSLLFTLYLIIQKIQDNLQSIKIREFSKIRRNKIKMQKSTAFLYRRNKSLETVIKK